MWPAQAGCQREHNVLIRFLQNMPLAGEHFHTGDVRDLPDWIAKPCLMRGTAEFVGRVDRSVPATIPGPPVPVVPAPEVESAAEAAVDIAEGIPPYPDVEERPAPQRLSFWDRLRALISGN